MSSTNQNRNDVENEETIYFATKHAAATKALALVNK